jgi:hypothetical protein
MPMLKEQKKNICNFIHFSLALWEVGLRLSYASFDYINKKTFI